MARNFFQFFTENNPARGTEKKYIPDVNWLKEYLTIFHVYNKVPDTLFYFPKCNNKLYIFIYLFLFCVLLFFYERNGNEQMKINATVFWCIRPMHCTSELLITSARGGNTFFPHSFMGTQEPDH